MAKHSQDIIYLAVTIITAISLLITFKRSYVIGVIGIFSGASFVFLNFSLGSVLSYFGWNDCNIQEVFYMKSWVCGKADVIGYVGYGLIAGGFALLLFQFISETFLHGNKQ